MLDDVSVARSVEYMSVLSVLESVHTSQSTITTKARVTEGLHPQKRLTNLASLFRKRFYIAALLDRENFALTEHIWGFTSKKEVKACLIKSEGEYRLGR